MSINTVQRKIERIQRSIQQLQKKVSNENKKESRKNDQIQRALRSISNTKNLSTAKTQQRKIERLEKDLIKIQKKKADLSQKIASKTSDLHKAQRDLYKEQDKEQKKLQDELEKRSRESKQEISKLLSQLDSPPENEEELSNSPKSHDAFISHASEDKDEIVRPLAEGLQNKGFDIWYDEFQLEVGDSLRRSIDKGLANSKFGIVILSSNFFAKNWPQYELDGLVQKEMNGKKVILPLWHKITKNEVMEYSPSLADKLALNTTNYTVEEIVKELSKVLK